MATDFYYVKNGEGPAATSGSVVSKNLTKVMYFFADVSLQVTVHITGSFNNGTVFWDTRTTGSPYTYAVHFPILSLEVCCLTFLQVNGREVVRGLDRASLGMQV